VQTVSHRDALHRQTRYAYNAAGNIDHRLDAAGHRLAYQWDKLGRLSTLKNENQRQYTFQYDPVGRLLQERGFDDKVTQYRYAQSSGVLEQVIDGELKTQLEFDELGRLTQRSASVAGSAPQTETYAYTRNGQLAQAENANTQLKWFYDEAGNLTREHQTYPNQQTAVWQHFYDELNQRTGTQRPDGHTTQWLTYGSGHVHGLMLDGQELIAYERDDLHREVKRVQANQIEQQQTFDTMGRLKEQRYFHQTHHAPFFSPESLANAGAQTPEQIEIHLQRTLFQSIRPPIDKHGQPQSVHANFTDGKTPMVSVQPPHL
jgi:YD repeat-containing protein